MSEDESPSDGDSSGLVRKAARERRSGLIRKRLGAYLLTALIMVAVGELLGVRTLVKNYFDPPVLDSSVIENRIADLKKAAQERVGSETRVLGRGFRSRPEQIELPVDAVSLANQSAALVIAEVQPSNAGEVVDGDGKCPDWIELWNSGDRPLDASGWFLSDKTSEKKRGKWEIPRLVLLPDERVIIFASGLDYYDENEIHTNFRISSKRDSIILVRPDGVTIEQTVSLGVPDASHGVTYAGAEGEPRVFVRPTPLQSNSEIANGFVGPVICSEGSRLFDDDFTVSLRCETPNALIRYTLDGSVPTEQNGELYTQSMGIRGTSVIRARAFGERLVASPVLIRSFLKTDDLVSQSSSPAGFPSAWNGLAADYEMNPQIIESRERGIKSALTKLPIVSVVAPIESLFGVNGIYSQSLLRGGEWEIPGVMEFLPHQGEEGFQASCGLRITGEESRHPGWKKHSFRLSFRSRYGMSVLKQPIFETLEVDGANYGTGSLSGPARELLENEGVLIDETHGLQSRTTGRFEGVICGEYGDREGKYLWTIDQRGINLARDLTPFPTPRGHVVHSNLSSTASLGGEAWFTSEDSVTINARSGRFGASTGMSRAEWDATIRFWESLGYNVNAIPGQDRGSSLVLRSASDSWLSPQVAVRSRAQYMRDQWTRRTALEMGRLAARGRFVHVCVNGLYWGIYNLLERPDDEFLAHQLGEAEDYYVTIRGIGGRIETNGSGEEMWDEISQLASADLNQPAQFAAISKLVDIDDLIDYCLILMYAGAEDWALNDGNNLRAYYRRGRNAKLKFMIDRADATFASGWKNDSVEFPLPISDFARQGSFAYLFQRLMKSEEFQNRFTARVKKLCGRDGVLGPAACEQRYRDLINEVEPVLVAELARWGDVHADSSEALMLGWQEQKKWTLENWFPNRTQILLDELKRCGLISENLAIQLPNQ